jgi:hypothetical protein
VSNENPYQGKALLVARRVAILSCGHQIDIADSTIARRGESVYCRGCKKQSTVQAVVVENG